jgi:hypothetical protein
MEARYTLPDIIHACHEGYVGQASLPPDECIKNNRDLINSPPLRAEADCVAGVVEVEHLRTTLPAHPSCASGGIRAIAAFKTLCPSREYDRTIEMNVEDDPYSASPRDGPEKPGSNVGAVASNPVPSQNRQHPHLVEGIRSGLGDRAPKQWAMRAIDKLRGTWDRIDVDTAKENKYVLKVVYGSPPTNPAVIWLDTRTVARAVLSELVAVGRHPSSDHISLWVWAQSLAGKGETGRQLVIPHGHAEYNDQNDQIEFKPWKP